MAAGNKSFLRSHRRGLIQIAKNLNIHIIAEGVETENQLNTLNGYECEYQQGFYYAPTMERKLSLRFSAVRWRNHGSLWKRKRKDGALKAHL